MDAPQTLSRSQWWWERLWQKSRLWLTLYVLVLPTLVTISVFSYYPKVDVVVKSLYRWQPPAVEEFVGLRNFQDAFADPLFWQSFQLVLILLAANLIKMWPAIFAAVALHRLSNERLRYIFQVCFVVPMVIPGMVWLLIWKSFYDPDFGILNRVLNASGLMNFLFWLDGTPADPGVMPRLAASLSPFIEGVIQPVWNGIGGIVVAGMLFILASVRRKDTAYQLPMFGSLLGLGAIAWGLQLSGGALWWLGVPAGIVLFWLLAREVGPVWVLWMFSYAAGLMLFNGRLELWLIWLVLALVLSGLLFRKLEFYLAQRTLKQAGWALVLSGLFLMLAGGSWTFSTGQFAEGAPAWLGSKDLVIPAIVFWGFPWVGTTGTLIYLAGLQQIPQDVYEASELDGIGPIGMLFRIELPLILTQVRINLIFMTISTLVTYEMFLILLGPDGGPGNKGMVPGLYMFTSAFQQGRFGYACALGMILFVIILGLTIIYNKYVKVEK